MEEYAQKYLDVYSLFLSYLVSSENLPTSNIDFLLKMPNPDKDKYSCLFLDYSNPMEEMQEAMYQEMLEAEGEDDEEMEMMPPKKEVPEEMLKLRSHCKSLLQSLWDSILRSPLSSKSTLLILKNMNTKIFPKISSPIVFSDFIISAYDLANTQNSTKKNVILAIHALSSLFVLMTNHGLDYTSVNFYQKLYLLLGSLKLIFSMQEKEKFLRLLELSLKSPMLPAAIAASFIKKTLRIILNENLCQATICIWAISFVCNVIKKHQVLTKMINSEVKKQSNRLQRVEERKLKKRDRKARVKSGQKSDPDSVFTSGFVKRDVFDMAKVDPMKTGAIETCLWEILPFLNHNLKIVRDYASVVCTDFQSKKSLPSEELSKLSEGQLIASQLSDISKMKTLRFTEIERIDDM